MTRVTIQGRRGAFFAGATIRTALAAAVVSAGLGAALWFRKPEREHDTSVNSILAGPQPLTLQHRSTTGWQPLGNPPPTGPLGSLPLNAPPVVSAAPWTEASPIPLRNAPTPDVGAGPATTSLSSLADPPAGQAGSSGLETPIYPKVSLQWSPEPPPADEPRGLLTHKVREGETLSSLAGRYLGSRDRYREIYLANRAVLVSPDRVVVGMELKIPLSGYEPASNGTAANDPPPKASAPSPVPGTMTPIHHGVWRRSTAAGASQRTYSVRKDDTLSGIALQFYGDPRKYLELYEANRHQMRTPNDLREGMLLVVP